MMEKIFPSCIFALMCGSAVVYASQGDWRRMLYWVGAALVTGAVTF